MVTMAKQNSLEAIVDEGIFEIYRTQSPGLVNAIRDLLAGGCTPAQIEKHLALRGKPAEIRLHVRCIAEHLARLG
jgi:hypothetical protein